MTAPRPMTFVLDLETIGQWPVEHDSAIVEMAEAGGKHPEAFAALSPALTTIVCVGMRHLESGRDNALLNVAPFTSAIPQPENTELFGSERLLLGRTNELLAKATRIVTFNGRSFDVPVLVHRMVANGVKPCSLLMRCARQPRYRGDGAHVDILEQFTFSGATKGGGQFLRAFALGYGLPDPKADGCGAEVAQLVGRGEAGKLVSYCLRDVWTTAELFTRWSDLAGVA